MNLYIEYLQADEKEDARSPFLALSLRLSAISFLALLLSPLRARLSLSLSLGRLRLAHPLTFFSTFFILTFPVSPPSYPSTFGLPILHSVFANRN